MNLLLSTQIIIWFYGLYLSVKENYQNKSSPNSLYFIYFQPDNKCCDLMNTVGCFIGLGRIVLLGWGGLSYWVGRIVLLGWEDCLIRLGRIVLLGWGGLSYPVGEDCLIGLGRIVLSGWGGLSY